ncbi:MAG: ribosome-associated translation inhibitor RaiA [Waddliaceae bacterium]
MSRKSKAAQFADDTYQIHVTGRNVNVTEPMKQYAIEKVSKIERFTDRVIDVLVIMDVQKIDHRCEIVMRMGHTKIIGHATTTDMYASVDLAVQKIEKQIRRYKKRLQEHQTKSLSLTDLKVNVFRRAEEEEEADVNLDIEETNQNDLIDKYRPHEVVAQKTKPLLTLTIDEVMMKMELSQDNFLVYRSEEDRALKVIYRRKDEDFGIIEIES